MQIFLNTIRPSIHPRSLAFLPATNVVNAFLPVICSYPFTCANRCTPPFRSFSTSVSIWSNSRLMAPCGAGASFFPLVHLLPHLFPLYFSLSFICFTYFLFLSIPSFSTRIVPLRFQAGGRRRRPNLGLVCVLSCNLCYLYPLVKMDCGVLFYLV